MMIRIECLKIWVLIPMNHFSLIPSKNFQKELKKLNKDIQIQTKKKLKILSDNPRHPSLRTKQNYKFSKMFERKVFESSINMNYRLLWFFDEDKIIILLTIGQHKIVE